MTANLALLDSALALGSLQSWAVTPGTQLPWWDWSLIAMGCWLLAYLVLLPLHKNQRLFRLLGVPLALIFGLAGFAAAATAVIRFVRWAWGS